MPKLNIYVPDELAKAIKGTRIELSRVCQDALRQALRKPASVETEGNGMSFKLVKITDTAVRGNVLYLNNEHGQNSARIIVVLSSVKGWVEADHLSTPHTEILLSGGHVIRAIVSDEYELDPGEYPLVDLNELLWTHFARVPAGDIIEGRPGQKEE